MKNLSTFVFFIVIGYSIAMADAPLQPLAASKVVIPNNLWDQRSEGVAIAMYLTSQKESEGQKAILQIYIKNTSPVAKSVYALRFSGLQLFYAKDGKQLPLRNYTHSSTEHISISGQSSDTIEPGEVLPFVIDLTPEELLLVKSNFVKCQFSISDEDKADKIYGIESSSKALTAVTSVLDK